MQKVKTDGRKAALRPLGRSDEKPGELKVIHSKRVDRRRFCERYLRYSADLNRRMREVPRFLGQECAVCAAESKEPATANPFHCRAWRMQRSKSLKG